MSWQGLLNTVSKGYAKHKSYFARGLDSSPVADEAALAAAEAEEAAANAAAEAEAAALHATNITLNTYPSSSLGIYLA